MEPGALEYFLPLVITWKIVNHLTRWGEKEREKQNILFYMCQTSRKRKNACFLSAALASVCKIKMAINCLCVGEKERERQRERDRERESKRQENMTQNKNEK